MALVWKARHIDADLRYQHLRGDITDTRRGRQQQGALADRASRFFPPQRPIPPGFSSARESHPNGTSTSCDGARSLDRAARRSVRLAFCGRCLGQDLPILPGLLRLG